VLFNTTTGATIFTKNVMCYFGVIRSSDFRLKFDNVSYTGGMNAWMQYENKVEAQINVYV